MSATLASGSFEKLINRFDKTIAGHYFQTDPHARLIPQREFDRSLGEQPTVISLTSEKPTGYPTALAGLNTTDGPGASGDVTATEVRTGQKKRQYSLVVDAWRSQVINQSDQAWRHDPVMVIKNVEEGLMEYSLLRNADFRRIQNIKMVDNKVVVSGNGIYTMVENADANHDEICVAHRGVAQAGAASTITLASGASAVNDAYNGREIHIIAGTGKGQFRTISGYVGSTRVATVSVAWTTQPNSTSVYKVLSATLPTHTLSWPLLDLLTLEHQRRGSSRFAIGYADGSPVVSLSVAPEEKGKLFQADLQVDVRYSMPNENFTVRGIKKAVRGYLPNEDLFAPRLGRDLELIYPFVNQDTSNGRESVLNPDYRPVSRGGKALYGIATILTQEVYEIRPRPVDPTSYARASFTAQNYTGELKWIIPPAVAAIGDNDLKNKGYYRCDWQLSAKPLRPYLGFSVLYRLATEVS